MKVILRKALKLIDHHQRGNFNKAIIKSILIKLTKRHNLNEFNERECLI